MQIIYQNGDEESCNRRTDSMDIVIYTRRISGYVEGKYVRRFKRGFVGI